jgi:poly-gamma-glutamate synthesis protein (capsule biosynthesis protein)
MMGSTFFVLALAAALAAPPPPGAAPTGPSFTVGFVGDVSFAGQRGRPEDVFAGVREVLSRPDLTVCNVEGLLLAGGAPKYGEARLDISANPRWAAAFGASGIDLLGTANNHSWDAGAAGVLEHLGHLEDTGLPVLGIGRRSAEASAEVAARAPRRIQSSVGCLSIVPATLKSNRPAERGEAQAHDKAGPVAAVAWYSSDDDTRPGQRPLADLLALVRTERAAGCAPIVSIHWGREGKPRPDRQVIAVGDALVEAGAALVVGHHPHVLQGFEWRGDAAIAWSLGNFVFANRDPDKRRTGLLEARFASAMGASPGDVASTAGAPRLVELAFTPMTIAPETFTPRLATPRELGPHRDAAKARSDDLDVVPDGARWVLRAR